MSVASPSVCAVAVVAAAGGGHAWWKWPGLMEAIMLIDCERCVMRDIACADCVVTALLRLPGQPGRPGQPGQTGRVAEIGEAERRALRVLADAKLVSPLRMRGSVARAS
jgi:hypothetical protein